MNQTAILPLHLCPSIAWWTKAIQNETIAFNSAAYFQKMSGENKYKIATANGELLLSVPIIGGRNQKEKSFLLKIDNTSNWQNNHWRTIISAYKRAPYFEHFESNLSPIFHTKYEYLVDLSLAIIDWVKNELKFKTKFEKKEITEPIIYSEINLLKTKLSNQKPYNQVFQAKNSFIQNLSILDLMMNEGVFARNYLC